MSIELDRQFVELHENQESDLDTVADFGESVGALTWTDLLARRRVVLLAEAGSGKTTEMKARARQQSEAGRYSFYVTVQDVGRIGLLESMNAPDRARFADWRSSENAGWLFVDSVDEAKQSGIRLAAALRALAVAIFGAERRAHVFLSGRYTDWEFRRDLTELSEQLALPLDKALPPPPTPDELIVGALHHERVESSPAPEQPIVVVMAGLDATRVRQFATEKGVENLDTFIARLDAADLWQFARRPLDLDWLVQFWHSHKRLGALAEMLEICISERVQESNRDRARQDNLNTTRAYHAVERTGAAMVLGYRDTIAVPDSEIDLTDSASLIDLADVLPDWSALERERLLTRAVFDPATLGRVRIHNDNQGTVRSYLAARWLHRLRQNDLSQQTLFDLLFSDEYGIPVVRPSMLRVAAWLSLRDASVAREVMKREPFLLLDTGDPSSLATTTRQALLTQVVERIASGEEIPPLDADNLKRFCQPDLAATVRGLWKKHSKHQEIRRLLLRVIWLGEIRDCADLATKIALDSSSAQREATFAGGALLTIADAKTMEEYARFITDHAANLSPRVVWNAAEGLFPKFLSVDDLIDLIGKMSVAARPGELGLEWFGPRLITKISSKADLERTLEALLAQLGGTTSSDDREATPHEEAYFPVIAAGANHLLELSSLDEVPLAAVDTAIRLGESIRTSHSARERKPDVIARLEASLPRRRFSFWRFAERFAGHRLLQGRPIDSLWDLRMLGWAVTLGTEDIDWLLADAPTRRVESERELGISASIEIARENNLPSTSLDRIRAAAGTDAAMSRAVKSWLEPREKPPALIEREHRLKESQHRNAIERARKDESWITFAARIRENPAEMRSLRPTTSAGCDARLFHLWLLLSQTVGTVRHYSISKVAALEPMIGAEATEGFRLGLIAHWRAWTPWIHSKRSKDEQNQVRSLDSMGLAGIMLEATANPNWANELGDDDARKAAEYATLELNGFPSWLAKLAHAKPAVVRDVLLCEARAELNLPSDAPRLWVIQALARADAFLAELIAPAILTELEGRSNLSPGVLARILDIVGRGPASQHARLTTLLRNRFDVATAPASSNLYLASLFSVDGELGTKAILTRLKKLRPKDRPTFILRALPSIFGRHSSDDNSSIHKLPLRSLERMLRLAFNEIRLEDDNVHPSGVVYSPDERDDAESARGKAFGQLLNTPGRAGFDAIMRLTKVRGFPIPKARLLVFAKERAAKDSELSPWTPDQVVAFEKTAETQPRTPRELQVIGLRRLTDLQYDLIHDDFQQGETLSVLDSEKKVQKFIADRLRLKQGQSYSVEREVHVADEKEPDVRFRAKATDASVPIEIKIAESWTLGELEDALETQLCDKYLRARESRFGVLLLVHQKPKVRGWTSRTGTKLTFAAVVAHLKKKAINICGSAVDAPQPEIAAIDVTRFVTSGVAHKRPAKRTPVKTKKTNSAKRKMKLPRKQAKSRRKRHQI
ncbi:hypothetical protein [Bradyrhizobium sp. AUGA SZCCT0160]|uniref:hypothetical protein n=1 Tax=Bradyrhizobium sp. AUGA SZCCT0160 TaxID=2807662 RepID=UPI001BA6C607|nr:hypothetical protein [Bradyrhizobium sp. AUGA SZCCT0160]MBR1188509.1 hypothetical protein [Bradyrhizobium sp. AUGA SZCCT0160]